MLGGGQLGRMFALAARNLGYRIVTLEPEPDSPCGQVADAQIETPYDDSVGLRRLADMCDAITLEFENVPSAAIKTLEQLEKPVHPGSGLLKVTQNRNLEKTFARDAGVAPTHFRKLRDEDDLEISAREIGLPAVIKTTMGGYDGKGQWVVSDLDQAKKAWKEAKGQELIWEKKVEFVKELSVVCARNALGERVAYPVSENIHRKNILDVSIVPARISEEQAQSARDAALRLAEALGLVGVFCVEFFLLENGELLLNEMAPRPHNSGHYTIDACICSQFEQQLRAVCGLPLGSVELLRPAVMVNIMGEGKGDRLLGTEALLADPAVRLHLYGKKRAKAGRKMGHFTVLGADVAEALEKAEKVRALLSWSD